MRQLLPVPADPVDPYEAYRSPEPATRLVRANMVASADGAATDPEGRSGGLGGAGDKEIFRTLRALCDVVLVGAGTTRTEGYGPHRLPQRLATRRQADGHADPAPIAVVSRSLRLDYDSPLFTEAVVPTIVVTCEAAPAEARRRAAQAGRVLIAGGDDVDLGAALSELQEQLGLGHVLCEGGPGLLGQLVEARLLDELCLTVAPVLANLGAKPLVEQLAAARWLRLHAACEQDGELYLRYQL